MFRICLIFCCFGLEVMKSLTSYLIAVHRICCEGRGYHGFSFQSFGFIRHNLAHEIFQPLGIQVCHVQNILWGSCEPCESKGAFIVFEF